MAPARPRPVARTCPEAGPPRTEARRALGTGRAASCTAAHNSATSCSYTPWVDG